jgi:hypothetical protein
MPADPSAADPPTADPPAAAPPTADPPAAARERLAAQQAALVRALIAGGPPPAGLDPARVVATASALARKRARQVAKTWPALAHSLGDGFTTRFVAYAAANPLPPGGALADGLGFARTLAQAGELTGEARVERLMAHAHLATGHRRRRLYCGVVLAGEPGARRLVVVLRAPLVRERWLSIPLGRDRHR